MLVPTMSPTSPTLRTARAAVTKKLAGLELPLAFQQATVASALNSVDRQTVSARASRRRAVAKACRVSEADTRPPAAAELDAVAAFEQSIREAGEPSARLDFLSLLSGGAR